ncbi:tumor necrosis factor receptor superfamily member 16-like [Ptychodera flava]|uniref:tumor necrosis factor receptor superfamily member 16-like n=1 Tax=Ptychodera flava TaxID=63121 RepID=UPI00396A90F3
MSAISALPLLYLCMVISVCYSCNSNEYTDHGECCEDCQAGYGVVKKCLQSNNTVCIQCEPKTTFSSIASHTAPCQSCSECPPNMDVLHPCNATNDTVCECSDNYYMNQLDNSCSQCDICPAGFGALVMCSVNYNSECIECENGTYSDEFSTTGQCKQCSDCKDDQVVLSPCTTLSNTICLDKNVYFGEPVTSQIELTLTTRGQNLVNYTKTESSSVVPIYCSVLGAIIVGLVLYVGCKRYKVWKNKPKHHKVRSSPSKSAAAPPPHVHDIEIGRHHGSDSGIFTNVDSLSTTNGGPRIPLLSLPATTHYKDLADEKKRQLEKQLSVSGAHGGDWKALAKELGFNENAIVEFSYSSHPVRKVLSQWSKKEDSTLAVFTTALQQIRRDDVVSSIPIYVNLANLQSLPS